MTSLVRWNPMREMMSLRNEMNRLFEQAAIEVEADCDGDQQQGGKRLRETFCWGREHNQGR